MPDLPNRPIHILNTHTGPINTLAFSQLGGTYILTGSSDRQIHLTRTEPQQSSTNNEPVTTTQPIQKYTSHGYAVLDLSVTIANTHFASCSADRSGPFLWDIQQPNTTLRRFGGNSSQGHTSRITCVSFCADDDAVLASGSDDRSVRLWDMKSRDSRPLQVLEEAKDGVAALVCRGYEVIAGSVDGRVRSYDVRMGRVVTDVQAGAVTSLDVSKDARLMLVGCLDGKIRVMDRENGACLRSVPEESTSKGYSNDTLRLQSCFGANEAIIVSGSESDGKVRAWDVLSGRLVGEVNVSDSNKVVSVVKWRDGSQVQGRREVWAAGAADGIVKVFAN